MIKHLSLFLYFFTFSLLLNAQGEQLSYRMEFLKPGLPTASPVIIPEKTTADQVLAGYFESLGGKENLIMVKDVKITSTASIMGQELKFTLAKKSPDKSYLLISTQGNEMQKEIINGDKVAVYQMGNALPMNKEIAEEVKVTVGFIPELYYKANGITTTLIGMVKVEGKEAYALEIVLPSGKVFTNYYAKATGLKIRETQTINTPQGELELSTDFKDYKEVDGIKFPHTRLIPIPGLPQKLKAEVNSIELNTGMGDEIFIVDVP